MVLLFLLISVAFIWLGLSWYLGRDKHSWWSKSTPVVPTSIVFGAFPGALMCLLMAYTFLPNLPLVTRQLVFDYGVSPLILFTIILTIWQPRWLKPKWLRWLEDNHGDIIPLLKEEAFEAEKRQRNSWTQRVKTQEGLEEWVAEVRHKHGLD